MKKISKILAYPFIFLIRIYQWVFSPYLGRQCRFTPTCSEYGIEAFKKHGLWKGFYLTARRLLACRPGGRSGYDPVP